MTQSYVDTGLTNGTPYWYTVTALNAAGESANSAQVEGIPNVVRAPSWYPYGVVPAGWTLAQMCQQFTAAYNSWVTLCVTNKGMPAGMPATAYRVQVPDQNDPTTGQPGGTFSESIGYGCFLSVYAADPTSPIYDPNAMSYLLGFSQYYRYFMNANGFMNWRIDNNGNVTGTGGATDADQDVAYAWVIAYRKGYGAQFGTWATALINAIDQYEFVPATDPTYPHIMTNGDQWGFQANRLDPDYAHPAAWQAFSEHPGTDSARWQAIIKANQAICTTFFYNNFPTGYVPDGCLRSGAQEPAGQDGYGYGYNAIRHPFRNALRYFNSGDTVAGNMLQKLAAFENSYSSGVPSACRAEGNLTGTTFATYINMAYMSGFFIAACASSATSTFAGAAVSFLQQQTEQSYFGQSLRAINLLIGTGEARNYTPGAVTVVQAQAHLTIRTQVSAAPVPPQFLLKQSDDFLTLDPTRWYTRDGFAGTGGDGTYSAACVSIANGVLQMEPNADSIPGIESQLRGQTYGKWDVWAYWDAAQGYLPRFYLYPDDGNYNEGDIEFIRFTDTSGGSFQFLTHNVGGNPSIAQVQASIPENIKSGFVKFTIEWLPNSLTLLVNDTQVLQTNDPNGIPSYPCHLIIQQDVGVTNGHNGVTPRTNYPAALTAPNNNPGASTATATLYIDRVDTYSSAANATVISASAQFKGRPQLLANPHSIQPARAGLKTTGRLTATGMIASQGSASLRTRARLQATPGLSVTATANLRTQTRLRATAVLVKQAGGQFRTGLQFRCSPGAGALVIPAAASLGTRARLAAIPNLIVVQFTTAHINFGPQGVTPPVGYLEDYGMPFTPQQGYGWELGALPSVVAASAALKARPQLQATAIETYQASAAFKVRPRLQATGLIVFPAQGHFTQRTQLQAGSVTVRTGQSVVKAQVRLQATGVAIKASTASVATRTQLVGTGTKIVILGDSGALTARTRVQATGALVKPASASMTARTSVSATGVLVKPAASSLTARGGLTSSGTLVRLATGALKTRPKLAATAAVPFSNGIAALTARSQLAGTGLVVVIKSGVGAFKARPQLTGTGAQKLLVDTLGIQGAQVDYAYSFRALKAGVTRSFVVRRSTDGATMDIGFTSTGGLDLATLNTFCSGATGTVARMYDQSGNGWDQIQPTASAQPIIYQSGSVVTATVNGVTQPATYNDGNRWMASSAVTNYTGATLWGNTVANIVSTSASLSTRYLGFVGSSNTDNHDKEGIALIERNGGGSSPSQGWQMTRNLVQKSNVGGTYGQLDQITATVTDGSAYLLTCAGTDGTSAGDLVGNFAITTICAFGAANSSGDGAVAGVYQSEILGGFAALGATPKATLRASQRQYFGCS